jgi:hypothetical protein
MDCTVIEGPPTGAYIGGHPRSSAAGTAPKAWSVGRKRIAWSRETGKGRDRERSAGPPSCGLKERKKLCFTHIREGRPRAGFQRARPDKS